MRQPRQCLHQADLHVLDRSQWAKGGTFLLVQKQLVRDLIPDLEAPKDLVIEKVEGALNRRGHAFIVTDNDGVDDSSSEMQLFRLGKID